MRPSSQRRVPRAWVLPCLVVLALLAAPVRPENPNALKFWHLPRPRSSLD